MFSLPASMKKIRSKMKALEWSEHLPHYNPMGAMRCHGHQSSDPIWPKTMQPFPHPNDASVKILFGPLVAEIFEFKNVHRQTHRQTTARPVYYKLTLSLRLR